jgi:UDP:flavonoid glycosyltransferase YjiC (YdhE family)
VRIAVCSLSQYSYVIKFVDAAQRLNERAQVRYFSGWRFDAAAEVLRQRGLEHEVLLAAPPRGELFSPARAPTAAAVFEDCFFAQAEQTLPALLLALRAYRPDGLAVHWRDYAGMVAAEVLGVPWISFGSIASPIRAAASDPPFGAGLRRDASAAARRIAWQLKERFDRRIDAQFNTRLAQPFGLRGIAGVSTWCSSRLFLSTLVPSLSNANSPPPAHVRYVGSLFSRADRTADGHTTEAIEALPRPRLFISLGTTYTAALLPRCLTAARDLNAGLIVSLGVPAGQASGQREVVELTTGARARCLVRPFFQAVDDVLQRADAVVSVGAGQTVMDALSHGRPLLCLPQQGEQRDIALAIEERGAGRALIGNWMGADLNSAMVDVATNPAYSAAAGVLREEARAAGGATVAAAAVLDALGTAVA